MSFFFRAVKIPTAFFLLAVSISGCHRQSSEAYEKAQNLWLAGRYPEAVSKLMVIVEEHGGDPAAAKALFRLGEIHYLNLDEPRKALDYFVRAASKNAATQIGLKSHNYIAEIYLEAMGAYDLAVLQYQRIINEYKSQIKEEEYRYLIGRAYFKKGDYTQAVIEYQSLVELFPTSELTYEARYQIANCHFVSGHTKEALRLFTILLAEATSMQYDYDLRLGIAICYEELSQLESALEAYKELIEHYPQRQILERKKASIEKRIAKKVIRKNKGSR